MLVLVAPSALPGQRPRRPVAVVSALLCSCVLNAAAAAVAPGDMLPGLGGPHAWLVPASELPLSTRGRYIVGRGGSRVKWACVNWYGAYSTTFVPGGLEVRTLADIARRIRELGFNCVRLSYSTQAHLENPVVARENVLRNPQFWGRRFLDVWDATVASLTALGLMVVINNQVHAAGWCCHYQQDEGLWYSAEFPEEVWIKSLVDMARRHRHDPLVVGVDLRNEVHDYAGTSLSWGDGNPQTDWAAAATRAGNAVLDANPNVLIVVSALCFGMDLRSVKDAPIRLAVPDRVVYEVHNYLEYQAWSLISQGFVSWRTIRWSTGFASAAAALVLVLLFAKWRCSRRGEPCRRPSPDAVALACGGWICMLALLAAGVCQGLAVFLMQGAPACGYWARRDLLPARGGFLALAALGLLLAAAGFTLIQRRRKVGEDARGSAELESRQRCARGSAAQMPPTSSTGAAAPATTAATAGTGTSEDVEAAAAAVDRAQVVVQEQRPCVGGRRGCGCGLAAVRCNKSTVSLLSPSFRLHCAVLLLLLLLAFLSIFVFSFLASTYWLFRTNFEGMWGFALREGYSYTAPVWLGEFGNEARGVYWINLMRYLSENDLDFAYWALNGLKWTTGQPPSSLGA